MESSSFRMIDLLENKNDGKVFKSTPEPKVVTERKLPEVSL